MRSYLIATLVFPLVLSSCAYEGVIVRKDSGPLPFYESLGVDGSYKLALRDSSGMVRSQLVTPEVFEGYAEGQYFNDLQPGVSDKGGSAAAKGTASVSTNTTRGLALRSGGSANGHRLATNAAGIQRRPAIVKSPQSATSHSLASAPKTVTPAPVPPPVQSPVVTAHFAVAVPAVASAAPVKITQKSAVAPYATSKRYAAVVARAASADRTKIVAPAITSSAPASTAYVVKAKPETAPKAGAKSTKPAAKKAAQKKPVDLARSAHAATRAQIPLVR